jgi:hypothetical protein
MATDIALVERATALRDLMPREDAIKALVSEGNLKSDAIGALDTAGPRVDAQGRSISLVPFSAIPLCQARLRQLPLLDY